MSMLPPLRALSTIAVLPSPWLCAAVVSPAAVAVCLMISPRMYDSVKRLEPTLSVAGLAAAADIVIAMSHVDKIIFAIGFHSIASRFSFPWQVAKHRIITDAVHAAGGKIALQILHAGRYAYHPFSVAPSALKSPITPFRPRALTGWGVRRTIVAYARCARLAQRA